VHGRDVAAAPRPRGLAAGAALHLVAHGRGGSDRRPLLRFARLLERRRLCSRAVVSEIGDGDGWDSGIGMNGSGR
jgi:hypothetical protein